MSNTHERRREPRSKAHIPNAVRIITPEGECVADLLDVSSNGLGFGYYDFFCALNLNPGMIVKLKWMVNPETGLCFKIAPAPPGDEGMQECIDPSLEAMEAKVVWSHLNCVGVELVGGTREEVCTQLMRHCKV